MYEVCRRHGIDSPEWFDLEPDHAEAMRDHCDGVEDADTPMGLPAAIADAIGLDWRTMPDEDRDDLMILARAWSFNELAFEEPLRG